MSDMEDATAHTATGTIKPPFEPTATAYERMVKLFFHIICILKSKSSGTLYQIGRPLREKSTNFKMLINRG